MKVAVVTGSSSGIGKATATGLARDGYEVYACMRNTDMCGDDARPVFMDMEDYGSIDAAIKGIIRDSGRIDVLVNNAGYGQFGCMEDVKVDEFKKQFETNFFSIVHTLQAVVPHMRRQQGGTIVNVSSVAGRMGLPGSSAYISSKFALEGLSECLRYELGRFNINTTIIEPGVIKTGFFNSMRIPKTHADAEYERMTKGILSGLRMMVEMGTEPDGVARAIIDAIRDDPILPRYTVGSDAAMFMDAKRAKSDLEFERYMSKELFS